MPPTCKTCRRSDVDEINKLITSGKPLRYITDNYHIPNGSIQRHKEQCLRAMFADVIETKRAGLLSDIDEVKDEIKVVRQEFADDGKVRVALIARRLDAIEKEAKLTGAFVQDKANPVTVAEIAKGVIQDFLASGGTKEDAIKLAAKRYGILEADLIGI